MKPKIIKKDDVLFKIYKYKTKAGLFKLVVTHGKDGFKHSEPRSFTSKREEHCWNKVNKYINNSNFEKPIKKDKKNKVGQLIIEELDYKKVTNEVTSLYSEDKYLDKHLYRDYKNWDIKEFCKERNLINYKNKILNSVLAPSTINKIFSFVRQAFIHGNLKNLVTDQQRKIVELVLQGIDNTRRNKRKDEYFWTYSQFNYFIDCLYKDHDKWAIFFEIAGTTGNRVGEQRGYLRKHHNEFEKTLTIEQQAINNLYSHRTVIKKPKTISSIRVVSLSDRSNNNLIKYEKEFNINEPNSFLFFGKNRPVGQSTIARALAERVKRYNMPPMTMHGLRHCCETWLLNLEGLTPNDVGKIAEMMGHSVSVMLDTYMNLHAKKSDKLTNFFNN